MPSNADVGSCRGSNDRQCGETWIFRRATLRMPRRSRQTINREEAFFMKRTLLTLALITVAGAAGAQTVTTPPVGGGAVTPPSVGGGAVTTPPVAPPAVNTPAVPSRSVGAGGASVTTPPVSGGAVQAPSTGSAGATTPGINPPSVSTPGVPSRSVTAPSQANLPTMPNAQGSGSARAKIEADGYKNVQGLQRNSDGGWSGKAMRGGAMVDVQVDARGHVITR
jgi:hypothetical protein